MAYLDREATHQAMNAPGAPRWTQEKLAQEAAISLKQLCRIMTGASTTAETIGFIEEALSVRPGSLVRPEPSLDTILGDEWNVNGRRRVGKPKTAANGLRYEVFNVRSRRHADRIGRLKRYDTQQLSLRTRKRIDAVLNRHATVALKLQHLPFIARHITSGCDNGANCHWVLDEQVAGRTYGDLAGSGALGTSALLGLMTSLATALDALHGNDVILREILPDSIVLEDATQRLVLSDFELGKLLENVPTVSPARKWRSSPYVATEVQAGGQVTNSADWYAWGMLIVFGLSQGAIEDPGSAKEVLANSGLPANLAAVILGCLHPNPAKRPGSQAILSVLSKQKR